MDTSIVFGPEIPDRELDKEIDSVNDALAETGTISPDVDTSGLDGVGMGMGGGGGMGPGGDVGQNIADLVPMADYRNRLLEDILDGLQSGGFGGGGGGDGGGLMDTITDALPFIGGGALTGTAGLTALGTAGAGVLGSVGLGAVQDQLAKAGANAAENLGAEIDLTSFLRGGDPFQSITAGSLIATDMLTQGGDPMQTARLEAITRAMTPTGTLEAVEQIAGTGGPILPEDIPGSIGDMMDTGPLYQGPDPFNLGPAGTPGQRSGANARDQRFRNDPAANPSQVNRRPLDITANINLDPSGLNDLQRNLKRELENDLVPQITQQIERSLSIGGGGR